MTRTLCLALLLAAGLGTALTPGPAPAQATGQSVDLHFDGVISIPITVKSVHPDINYLQLMCALQPPAGAPNQTITFTDNPVPGASMSGGQWSGTLTTHFTVHRSSTFTPGEVWTYDCAVDFLKKTSPTSGESDGGTPGTGPSFKWWAQLASGNARVQGTFTLQ